MEILKPISLFFFAFAIITPSLNASIKEFDEYWQKKAEVAHDAAQKSYEPNPEAVTQDVNKEVHE